MEVFSVAVEEYVQVCAVFFRAKWSHIGLILRELNWQTLSFSAPKQCAPLVLSLVSQWVSCTCTSSSCLVLSWPCTVTEQPWPVWLDAWNRIDSTCSASGRKYSKFTVVMFLSLDLVLDLYISAQGEHGSPPENRTRLLRYRIKAHIDRSRTSRYFLLDCGHSMECFSELFSANWISLYIE